MFLHVADLGSIPSNIEPGAASSTTGMAPNTICKQCYKSIAAIKGQYIHIYKHAIMHRFVLYWRN